jgi:hypothetical protein
MCASAIVMTAHSRVQKSLDKSDGRDVEALTYVLPKA